jgi:hypothetical protein
MIAQGIALGYRFILARRALKGGHRQFGFIEYQLRFRAPHLFLHSK